MWIGQLINGIAEQAKKSKAKNAKLALAQQKLELAQQKQQIQLCKLKLQVQKQQWTQDYQEALLQIKVQKEKR